MTATQTRVRNFSPGPATLPVEVLEEARRDLLCLPGAGASVLEISHRSPRFRAILEEARENVARLLGLDERHHVLFLAGGATLQFSMVPMNLLRGTDHAAEYVVTGSWGRKALAAARCEGEARALWSGEEGGYRRVPEPHEIDPSPRAAYVHVTSNETIEGVQFRDVPDPGPVPLVCDASSDFLSRPVDAGRYALLYAGAQKNVGPAGVTVVVAREDLLERTAGGLPSLLDYRSQSRADGCVNTPPVFAIYLVALVTAWIRRQGGLEAMQRRNREKAALLYETVDRSDGFYTGHADPASRSDMNVTFRLPDAERERDFVQRAAERGLEGLSGHRSVGGIRASIYNAMPLEGVRALAEFMETYRQETDRRA